MTLLRAWWRYTVFPILAAWVVVMLAYSSTNVVTPRRHPWILTPVTTPACTETNLSACPSFMKETQP